MVIQPGRTSSIRMRLLLASTLIQVLLLSMLLYNSVRLMNEATAASISTLVSQNAAMIHAMATAYGEHDQLATLQDVLHELLVGAEEGLIYVRIARSDARLLLSAGNSASAESLDRDIDTVEFEPIRHGSVVHVRKPLLLDRNEVGFLQFGVSVSVLDTARSAILTQGSLIALLEIALTLLLLSGIGYLLTRNLDRLMAGSQAIAEGHLEHRIAVDGSDELAKLAARFNSMGDTLQDRIVQLEDTASRLNTSDERYALAMRGANDGLWDWDIAGKSAFLSPRFRELAGLGGEAEFDPETEHFPNIHPDDEREFNDRLVAHLRGRSEQFEMEFRTLGDDGERWILVRGVALRDPVSGRAHRMAGSITDIDQRKRAQAQLIHDAFHDKLTRLPNRALFLEHLDNAIRRANRGNTLVFAVLTINLERFHKVNDSFGHAAGDEVLRIVATRIGELIRDGDIAARVGGDQFAVLLNELIDAAQALTIAKRLRETLAMAVELDRHPYFPSSRIGIAFSTDGAIDAESMLRDSDNALHRADNRSISVFHASMHTQMLKTLQLETDLRHAIDNSLITVAYQPIVSLESEAIVSLEALARWNHPERGAIPPIEFIPLAESVGLIHPLSLCVLEHICITLKRWQGRAAGRPLPSVSLNLSALQFGRPDLPEEIIACVRMHELDPELLRIEITESAIAEVPARAVDILQRFRAAGLRVLIDDFGTGYSALSYLHTIPCDIIKFDGTFIHAITEDARLRALVRRSIELAHDLGMTVVAECIETEAQATTLRAMQCDFGQGYRYSRAIDAGAIESLLFEPMNPLQLRKP